MLFLVKNMSQCQVSPKLKALLKIDWPFIRKMVGEKRPGVKDLEFSVELAGGCDKVINMTIAVGRIIRKSVVNLIRHGNDISF